MTTTTRRRSAQTMAITDKLKKAKAAGLGETPTGKKASESLYASPAADKMEEDAEEKAEKGKKDDEGDE